MNEVLKLQKSFWEFLSPTRRENCSFFWFLAQVFGPIKSSNIMIFTEDPIGEFRPGQFWRLFLQPRWANLTWILLSFYLYSMLFSYIRNMHDHYLHANSFYKHVDSFSYAYEILERMEYNYYFCKYFLLCMHVKMVKNCIVWHDYVSCPTIIRVRPCGPDSVYVFVIGSKGLYKWLVQLHPSGPHLGVSGPHPDGQSWFISCLCRSHICLYHWARHLQYGNR